MMRISTLQIYGASTIGMRDAQVAIDQTNSQLSSGKRVLSPADDPVAATSILSVNQELDRTTQYKKNIDTADNNLSLEDTTLQSIVNTIQRLREIAVSAGNTAVLTAADYKSMGAEINAGLQQLVGLQNTKNASSQYIFAGFQSQTKPFESDLGGNFSYKGDEGQLKVQASSSVVVPVSDSGKRLFMDIPSSNNTFNTYSSPVNKASPPAVISVGDVVDQDAFDKFYPQNMKITFNANTAVSPPSSNYTVTDSATGKVIVANKVFVSGDDIVVNGAKFSIYGQPAAGTAAVPAAINFGAFTAKDFSTAPVGNQTLTVTVGGVTETLTLDQNITSASDLVTALGGNAFYPDPATLPISASPSAIANHAKLQNLGLSLTTSGFSTVSGQNITIKNGSTDITSMLGVATQGSGTTSVNLPFTFGSAVAFSTSPKTVDITVNGKTETLTLNTDVTDSNSLAAAFNTPANLNKLVKLGVTATPEGLIAKNNAVITLNNGDATINQVIGSQTQGSVGTSSSQGVLAIPGDSFMVESTNKQGLLTTVSRFNDALKNVTDTAESKQAFADVVAKTLNNLQNAIDSISAVQGDVGARQNMLDNTKDLHADTEAYGKTILSQLQDLDYADAATRLQMQTMVLSATQQSFVKVSQLSLFTYL